MHTQIARCEIAAAELTDGSERRAHLRAARRHARRQYGTSMQWGDYSGALAWAGILHTEGKIEASLAQLRLAERGYDEVGFKIFHATARYLRGAIVGGDEGRALRAESGAVFRGEGVSNLERTLSMLAPGFGRLIDPAQARPVALLPAP
jgi:hypothetical protein